MPLLPDGLLNVIAASVVVPGFLARALVSNWLKPVPVKVTVVDGDPGTMAVVSLVAVIVGATVLASAKPRPPESVNVAPLPAFGAGFATVTLHKIGVPLVATLVCVKVVVKDVELFQIVAGATAFEMAFVPATP